ncbi:MAG: MFS transporter [Gammaproteobacteria bacterium]|nr:MFS transporter [Gammaproteobacteria bacterium]
MNEQTNQFALLRQKRLAPLFYAQFFGAFNDNLFKAALTLIFVYSGIVAADSTDFAVNAAAGLFVLPFFLFSATAGQIADRYEKSRLIRAIKLIEVAIAFCAGLALYFQTVAGMLAVLFLLGLQSTFFGPLKFSILPQHLDESELIGGNALVGMGTFIAILLGTVAGGVIGGQESVSAWLFVLVLAVAGIGYFASRFIPNAPANAPDEVVRWNPITETWRLVKLARTQQSVFLSILGVSWFWLIGSVYLAQIPNLVRVHLAGGPSVVTLILTLFTLAIAAGSLFCERLSGHKIEIGLVPFGAFGISVFGIDSFFAIQGVSAAQDIAGGGVRGISAFLGTPGVGRLLFDLGMMGMFGGMFVVPLQAFIQLRSPEHRRARVIAVNNIMNALFMVGAAGFAITWLTVLDLTIPQLLLTVAVANFFVAIYIFKQVPEFTMRFLIWLLSHTMYRVKHEGLDNVPDEGAAIIVCNHVSFVDALLLAGAIRRPIRFVMFKAIFDIPLLNFIFRTGRAIPIIGRREDEQGYERAFAEIRSGLAAGDLLCIFPEGKLTLDGEIDEFRPGIERILADSPVPVVPVALRGLWGSFFSRKAGAFRNPSRFWSKVEVVADTVVAPSSATAEVLRERVSLLRGDAA